MYIQILLFQLLKLSLVCDENDGLITLNSKNKHDFFNSDGLISTLFLIKIPIKADMIWFWK